jgi:hypothetical protein
MRSTALARLIGLCCLGIAAAAFWWGIWEPLQRAIAQEPHVRYQLEVFVLVPFAAIFGLFFLLTGGRVACRNPERQRLTAVGWALVLVAVAGSGFGFWQFKSRFEALGYGYSGAAPVAPATLTPLPDGAPPTVEQPKFRLPSS